MLEKALPHTRAAILEATDRHALEFLQRLQERAKTDGPDGSVIRNPFDLSVLDQVISIYQEERDEVPQ